MTIRVLIADDEKLARERLHRMLADEPAIEIAGEAADGDETVAKVEALAPEVLFLDIEMPGRNGFSVLEAIPAEKMPIVIFTTAYDRYAVQAFEAHAFDYLLKPFREERLRDALSRARATLQLQAQPGDAEAPAEMIDAPALFPELRDRFLIRSGGRITFVRASEISWIEAASNYVKFHIGAETLSVRRTISQVESKLDSRQFLRIHRSSIVNVARINKIESCSRGDYSLFLDDGTELPMSRNYRSALEAFLKTAL